MCSFDFTSGLRRKVLKFRSIFPCKIFSRERSDVRALQANVHLGLSPGNPGVGL